MGSSISIHVGPYMLVKKKSIDKSTTVQECNNTECTNLGVAVKTQFCACCGNKVSDRTITITTVKNINEILHKKEFTDELVCAFESKTVDILIPNQRVPDGLRIDAYDNSVTEVLFDERATREVLWFFSNYTNVLSAIVKEYGEDNIEVKWGIITYYN